MTVTFKEIAKFDDAVLQETKWLGVKFLGALSAPKLECRGDFVFAGSAELEVQFNYAKFHGLVEFRGQTKHFAGGGGGSPLPPTEYTTCLGGTVNFQFIEFFQPQRVRISHADFSKASVVGTFFDEAALIDIKWAVGTNGRRTIYDDVVARNISDLKNAARRLPAIEHQCRSLRRHYERGENYPLANDFYIAEMEAARSQLPHIRRQFFSVNAIYRFLSYYGNSPLRAAGVFLGFAALYMALAAYITPEQVNVLKCFGLDEYRAGPIRNFTLGTLGYFLDAIQVMTLKESRNSLGLYGTATFLDTAFRIMGPIQIGMFGISIRNAIKRG